MDMKLGDYFAEFNYEPRLTGGGLFTDPIFFVLY